jgi:hypothetical protein
MDLAMQHLDLLKKGDTSCSSVLLDRHALMYERYLLMGISKENLLSISLQDLESMDDRWNTCMSFTDADIDVYLRSPEEVQFMQNANLDSQLKPRDI